MGKPGNSAAATQIQLRRLDCGGARAGTGRRLLSAPTQVRFLSPQLATAHSCRAQGGSRNEVGRASQLAIAAVSKTVEPPTARVPGLEGSTPSPSAAGSSNGRTRRFERRDVGPIPTPANERWSCRLAAKAALLQRAYRWFESTQDHSICPRGAAWSAHLPVTQEIVGSNPIGDACVNEECRIGE